MSVLTDMTDEIKMEKCALSTQNDLVMKKNEVNWSSSFCSIPHFRILVWIDRLIEGQTDDEQCSSSQLSACSWGY